jgi:hypothetical protein
MIDYLNDQGSYEYFKWCIDEMWILIREYRYILVVLQKVNEIVTFDGNELYSLHKTSWMIYIVESWIVNLAPWFKVMLSKHYYRKGGRLAFCFCRTIEFTEKIEAYLQIW